MNTRKGLLKLQVEWAMRRPMPAPGAQRLTLKTQLSGVSKSRYTVSEDSMDHFSFLGRACGIGMVMSSFKREWSYANLNPRRQTRTLKGITFFPFPRAVSDTSKTPDYDNSSTPLHDIVMMHHRLTKTAYVVTRMRCFCISHSFFFSCFLLFPIFL